MSKAAIHAVLDKDGRIEVRLEGSSLELLALAASTMDGVAHTLVKKAERTDMEAAELFAAYAAAVMPSAVRVDEAMRKKAGTALPVMMLARWESWTRTVHDLGACTREVRDDA